MIRAVVIFLIGILIGWLAAYCLLPIQCQLFAAPAIAVSARKDLQRREEIIPTPPSLHPVKHDMADNRTKSTGFAAMVEAEISKGGTSQMTEPLLHLWCIREPAASFGWITGTIGRDGPDSKEDIRHLKAALTLFMGQNLEGAGQAVQSLEPGRLRTTLVERYVGRLAWMRSPADALAWLKVAGNYDDYRNGVIAIAASIAEHPPYCLFRFMDENHEMITTKGKSYANNIIANIAAYTVSTDIMTPDEPFDMIYTVDERLNHQNIRKE